MQHWTEKPWVHKQEGVIEVRLATLNTDTIWTFYTNCIPIHLCCTDWLPMQYSIQTGYQCSTLYRLVTNRALYSDQKYRINQCNILYRSYTNTMLHRLGTNAVLYTYWLSIQCSIQTRNQYNDTDWVSVLYRLGTNSVLYFDLILMPAVKSSLYDSRLCTSLWTSMCTSLCTSLCTRLCTSLCTSLCISLCTSLCTSMCTSLCTSLYTSLCTSLCTNLCICLCTRMCTSQCTSLCTSTDTMNIAIKKMS